MQFSCLRFSSALNGDSVKMSKEQTLRVFVNDRLTAAAEEIFLLFERTIAEYEEEVCRCKEENKRKQQLLDSVLKPEILFNRDVLKVQEESWPSLDQENSCTKEEHQELSIKHEVTEFSFIPDLLKDEVEENREDCGRMGPDLEPSSQTDDQAQEQTDNEDDWEPPSSSSAQQKETKADRDDPNQVHSNNLDRGSQETLNGVLSVFGVKPKMIKKHVLRNAELQRHIWSCAGEKPFSCFACNKCFTRKSALKIHMSIHTKEKPVRCSECDSRFTQKRSLVAHMRTVHRKEKPFSCSVCQRCFPRKYSLHLHMSTHTGDKPFSCLVCKKSFTRKNNLRLHMSTHTGEKRFVCGVCNKGFTRKDRLTSHLVAHTGENPFPY